MFCISFVLHGKRFHKVNWTYVVFTVLFDASYNSAYKRPVLKTYKKASNDCYDACNFEIDKIESFFVSMTHLPRLWPFHVMLDSDLEFLHIVGEEPRLNDKNSISSYRKRAAKVSAKLVSRKSFYLVQESSGASLFMKIKTETFCLWRFFYSFEKFGEFLKYESFWRFNI